MNTLLDRRKYVVGGIIVVLTLIFLVKLFFIQVVNTRYKVSAEHNSQRHQTEYPARGLIYDRYNNILVYNQAAYDLMIVPREVQTFDTLDFCNMLEISYQQVRDDIKAAKKHSWYKPSIFLKQISAITYAKLQEKLFKFPGFFVQTRTLRKYPQSTAANVLGYVGEVDERQTKRDSYYKSGDYTGISGIEKTYEKELRGRKGVTIFLVDVHNRKQGSFQEGKYDTVAVSGKDIMTTIDAELQAYGELLMQNKIGSITAIEPSTGEILCMVSSPSYDPNLLVGRVRGQNYRVLSQDTLNPLFNRALMAQYPPGSTFKLANALIGMQEGVLKRTTSYSCSGPTSRPIRCSHNHVSPIALIESIEQSCNSYYWQVFNSIISNSKYKNTEEGFEAWRSYFLNLGFGSPVGADLFNELSGNIPTVQFYDKYYKKGGWRPMTIRSLSIGQGEILVTPIQLANFTAAIANRGVYIEPHIVKQVDGQAIDSRFERKESHIDSSAFELVVEGMGRVFDGDHGTARWYRLPEIAMCGKTGTAENPHGDDHSIFIAFAPRENPQIAISVVVENAGFGSTWAVPMASLMIEKYINRTVERKWIEERMTSGNLISKP